MREPTKPNSAPWHGWSVLGAALVSAALGVLFGALNRFEPAGSSAFWFNLVIPLASQTLLFRAFAPGQRQITTVRSIPLLSSDVPWSMPQTCPNASRL